MIDYLKDLITHTHDLGCIDLVKVSGTDDATSVEGLAEDRSVVIQATFHKPHDSTKIVLTAHQAHIEKG